MKITADFSKITGKIKPMHGVGQPPLTLWRVNDQYMHYLGEAGIPYSRLHDTGGRYGAGVYVDVPNIFRDFEADENDPASYDFIHTDRLLLLLREQGCQPIYRLGVTIENDEELRAYRIFPPKDFGKWARIAEHIVAHYNEGWAEGFRMGITYWEIWNEPDDCLPQPDSSMWHGTKEQYYDFYCTVARHLKTRFGDSIRVGGYASCGFYSRAIDPTGKGPEEDMVAYDEKGLPYIREGFSRMDFFIQFFHEFLRKVRAEKAPLDFFSWHSYADVPTTMAMHRYCQKSLAAEGFSGVETILDEWNTCVDDRRRTHYAAANILAMMLGMQKSGPAILNYYDASMSLMSYSGLFNAETKAPHPSYFTFMAFNRLYRLKNEVYTASENSEVYVGAATDGREKVLLVANRQSDPVEAVFDLTGASAEDAEILLIDSVYTYSPTGKKIKEGKFTLPPWSCAEFRLK